MATKSKKSRKVTTKSKTKSKMVFSRRVAFVAALFLSIATVVGFAMFAGTGTRGRVFSWRQGETQLDFESVQTAPKTSYNKSMIRFAGKDCLINRDSKGKSISASCGTTAPETVTSTTWVANKYTFKGEGTWLVYSEKTTPALGSRTLKKGDKGEDVALIKQALLYFSKVKMYKEDRDYVAGKDTRQFIELGKDPEFESLYRALADSNPFVFDLALERVLTELDTDTSVYLYEYYKTKKLSKHAQQRILNYATDPMEPRGTGKRILFDYKNLKVKGYGKVYTKEAAAAALGEPVVEHTTTFVGQKKYVGKDGKQRLFDKHNFFSASTKPEFNSRAFKKGDTGEDVKLWQSLLKYVSKKYLPGHEKYLSKGANLKVTGKWDAATIAAMQSYQKGSNLSITEGSNTEITTVLVKQLGWGFYKE